jgi:hypothetical protein
MRVNAQRAAALKGEPDKLVTLNRRRFSVNKVLSLIIAGVFAASTSVALAQAPKATPATPAAPAAKTEVKKDEKKSDKSKGKAEKGAKKSDKAADKGSAAPAPAPKK